MEELSVRINKYLAQEGICSRREADDLILKGLVTINGKAAKLGDKVKENDIVLVDNKSKLKKKYVYFAYYKPRGIVTHSPEKDQKSIKDITNFPVDVFPLGRLDRESHGLILLTNDGRVAKKLLSPEANHEKEYCLVVDKKVSKFLLRHLQEGVQLEDCLTKPCKIKEKGEDIFHIIITEGKKHQLRRMCAAFGYQVLDLKRIRVANIKLKSLKPREYRELEGEERADFFGRIRIKIKC